MPYKAEKFRMGTPSVSLFSRFGKFIASKGCQDFLSKFFFVFEFRKNPLRNPSVLCFRTFPVTKKIMDKRGGMGLSRISVESFSPQSTGSFRSGNLLCCVSESFR